MRTPWIQKARRPGAPQRPGSPPRRTRAHTPISPGAAVRASGDPGQLPRQQFQALAPRGRKPPSAPAAAKERSTLSPRPRKAGRARRRRLCFQGIHWGRGRGSFAPCASRAPLRSQAPVPAASAGHRGKQLAKGFREFFQKPRGKFVLLENSLGRSDPDWKNGYGPGSSREDFLPAPHRSPRGLSGVGPQEQGPGPAPGHPGPASPADPPVAP